MYLQVIFGNSQNVSMASRSWYQTLREELMKSGAVASKSDQTIFRWYFGNKLQGIIAADVDDLVLLGQRSVINWLCHVFVVKSEEVPIHSIRHKLRQN